MKYFSKAQVIESLKKVSSINQFFGLTFLAAKQAELPVNTTVSVSLDSITQDFLESYFHIDPRSEWYFRVYRFNNKDQYWLRPDYAGKGLQKLNTTTFKEVFIHEKKSKEWGWRTDYVDSLIEFLPNGEKIEVFHLAVWYFRRASFKDNELRQELIGKFYREFNITELERIKLFNENIISSLYEQEAFSETPVQWGEIVEEFEWAPDVDPEQGGILTYLELDDTGPVKPLLFEPSSRLNIITGDNGLGKTFILEAAWWALTGKWAGNAALPSRVDGQRPKGKIKYTISGKSKGRVETAVYSPSEDMWVDTEKRTTVSAIVIYSRVDGSYAISDPLWQFSKEDKAIVFDRDEIWNGDSNRRIEGLIRDLARWQDSPERYPFDIFERVIQRMSPPEMNTIKLGRQMRLPGDARDIPTVKHEYGEVPIVHESAGIKQLISLAYLLVWIWNEHKILSEQRSKSIQKRIVILIDELEAHLHPKWQRTILPAFLDVSKFLGADVEIQLIVSSHSPLVLASAETIFTPEIDKLFHLMLENNNREISFKELDFVKYGRVNSWLDSPIFDFTDPMNTKSQYAIEHAVSLQLREDVTKDEIQHATNLLVQSLAADDSFWNRWIFYAKKFGVTV